MTIDQYLTKRKSMLEWKLFSMLDKNPESVCSIDYDEPSKHPLFEELREIYLSNFFLK